MVRAPVSIRVTNQQFTVESLQGISKISLLLGRRRFVSIQENVL